jgi:hypothetical protein
MYESGYSLVPGNDTLATVDVPVEPFPMKLPPFARACFSILVEDDAPFEAVEPEPSPTPPPFDILECPLPTACVLLSGASAGEGGLVSPSKDEGPATKTVSESSETENADALSASSAPENRMTTGVGATADEDDEAVDCCGIKGVVYVCCENVF